MHLGVLTMFVGTGACILVHGSHHVIYHGVLIVDWQAIYIMPVMYISSDVIVMYIVVWHPMFVGTGACISAC